MGLFRMISEFLPDTATFQPIKENPQINLSSTAGWEGNGPADPQVNLPGWALAAVVCVYACVCVVSRAKPESKKCQDPLSTSALLSPVGP